MEKRKKILERMHLRLFQELIMLSKKRQRQYFSEIPQLLTHFIIFFAPKLDFILFKNVS